MNVVNLLLDVKQHPLILFIVNLLCVLLIYIQMLNIHERRQCGIPVIIEGETGVGKTALINMLSKLWNHAMIDEWRKVKGRIVEYLYKISCGMSNS